VPQELAEHLDLQVGIRLERTCQRDIRDRWPAQRTCRCLATVA